jgi:hypothetical protein
LLAQFPEQRPIQTNRAYAAKAGPRMIPNPDVARTKGIQMISEANKEEKRMQGKPSSPERNPKNLPTMNPMI